MEPSVTVTRLQASPFPRDVSVVGGFCQRGRYAWFFAGAALEVQEVATGSTLAAWSLEPGEIATVVEAEVRGLPVLLASTTAENGAGYIHVLDPVSGNLMRRLVLDRSVGHASCLLYLGDENFRRQAADMNFQFQCDDMLVVGTNTGRVLLVDLGFPTVHPDPVVQRRIVVMDAQDGNDQNLEQRVAAIRGAGDHPAYHLNAPSFNMNELRLPGSATGTSSRNAVSALYLIDVMCTLAVGHAFGAYSLLSLRDLQVVFSQPGPDIPVTNFRHLELDNDDATAYLWVAHGSPLNPLVPRANSHTGRSHGVFVRLEYLHYKRMPVINVDRHETKFSKQLTSGDPAISGRMIKLDLLARDPRAHKYSEDDDEVEVEERLSRCYFLWEQWRGPRGAYNPLEGEKLNMLIFDLTRFETVAYGDHGVEADYLFMTAIDLSKLPSAVPYVGAYLDMASVSVTENDPQTQHELENNDQLREQMLASNKLSFDMDMLTPQAVYHLSVLSDQQHVLAYLSERGPVIFETPRDAHVACCSCLLIRSQPGEPENNNKTYEQMREDLWRVCLENGLVSMICQYATEKAVGFAAVDDLDDDSAYVLSNPRVLMDWAWEYFQNLRKSLAVLYTAVKLYQEEGQRGADVLTANKIERASMERHMLHASAVFAVLDNLTLRSHTNHGEELLSMKLTDVSVVLQHLEMVSWFLMVKNERVRTRMRDRTALADAVKLRRQERRRRMEGSLMNSNTILFIDTLVVQTMSSEDAREWWDTADGMYPPSSLHSLLAIFCLGDPEAAKVKRSIVYYFLLDLTQKSNDGAVLENFARAFGLTPADCSLLRGFHLADMAFTERQPSILLAKACEHFNNPATPVQPYATKILRTLVDGGAHQHALSFMRAVQPTIANLEDMRVFMQVLTRHVPVPLIEEAFEFQRAAARTTIGVDKTIVESLMSLLIADCQEIKALDRLVALPLNAAEEACLVAQLQHTKKSESLDALFVYYLQRDRYVEAVKLQPLLSALPHSDKSASREAMTQTAKGLLPRVQRTLTEPVPASAAFMEDDGAAPVPFSSARFVRGHAPKANAGAAHKSAVAGAAGPTAPAFGAAQLQEVVRLTRTMENHAAKAATPGASLGTARTTDPFAGPPTTPRRTPAVVRNPSCVAFPPRPMTLGPVQPRKEEADDSLYHMPDMSVLMEATPAKRKQAAAAATARSPAPPKTPPARIADILRSNRTPGSSKKPTATSSFQASLDAASAMDTSPAPSRTPAGGQYSQGVESLRGTGPFGLRRPDDSTGMSLLAKPAPSTPVAKTPAASKTATPKSILKGKSSVSTDNINDSDMMEAFTTGIILPTPPRASVSLNVRGTTGMRGAGSSTTSSRDLGSNASVQDMVSSAPEASMPRSFSDMPEDRVNAAVEAAAVASTQAQAQAPRTTEKKKRGVSFGGDAALPETPAKSTRFADEAEPTPMDTTTSTTTTTTASTASTTGVAPAPAATPAATPAKSVGFAAPKTSTGDAPRPSLVATKDPVIAAPPANTTASGASTPVRPAFAAESPASTGMHTTPGAASTTVSPGKNVPVRGKVAASTLAPSAISTIQPLVTAIPLDDDEDDNEPVPMEDVSPASMPARGKTPSREPSKQASREPSRQASREPSVAPADPVIVPAAVADEPEPEPMDTTSTVSATPVSKKRAGRPRKIDAATPTGATPAPAPTPAAPTPAGAATNISPSSLRPGTRAKTNVQPPPTPTQGFTAQSEPIAALDAASTPAVRRSARGGRPGSFTPMNDDAAPAPDTRVESPPPAHVDGSMPPPDEDDDDEVMLLSPGLARPVRSSRKAAATGASAAPVAVRAVPVSRDAAVRTPGRRGRPPKAKM